MARKRKTYDARQPAGTCNNFFTTSQPLPMQRPTHIFNLLDLRSPSARIHQLVYAFCRHTDREKQTRAERGQPAWGGMAAFHNKSYIGRRRPCAELNRFFLLFPVAWLQLSFVADPSTSRRMSLGPIWAGHDPPPGRHASIEVRLAIRDQPSVL